MSYGLRFLRWMYTLPIHFYRKCISPWLPGCCRFTPSCSTYALEAIAEWGIVCGTGLAVWRILRCNPFCRGGYDPVPKRKKHQKKEETSPTEEEQTTD